jgi:hypothetical protein
MGVVLRAWLVITATAGVIFLGIIAFIQVNSYRALHFPDLEKVAIAKEQAITACVNLTTKGRETTLDDLIEAEIAAQIAVKNDKQWAGLDDYAHTAQVLQLWAETTEDYEIDGEVNRAGLANWWDSSLETKAQRNIWEPRCSELLTDAGIDLPEKSAQ